MSVYQALVQTMSGRSDLVVGLAHQHQALHDYLTDVSLVFWIWGDAVQLLR